MRQYHKTQLGGDKKSFCQFPALVFNYQSWDTYICQCVWLPGGRHKGYTLDTEATFCKMATILQR